MTSVGKNTVSAVSALALAAFAGRACGQQLFLQEPQIPTAYRWVNLAWFADELVSGGNRRIVLLGDSINSDDTNERMGRGRARQWDVAWSGWTSPACNTSTWGGYHLAWNHPGAIHSMIAPPATGGPPIPIGAGHLAWQPRYVDDVVFASDMGNGLVLSATDLPNAALTTQWKRGDWTVGRNLRGRLVYLNDPASGAAFDAWSYRDSMLQAISVVHSGVLGWTGADLDFGTVPASYNFNRLMTLTTQDEVETGKFLSMGGMHWYIAGESGPAYTPLGIAGWKSGDWATTTLLSQSALRTYFAAVRNPNTLMIQLGANDSGSEVPAGQYMINVSAVIQRAFAAYIANGGAPGDFGVILLSPYDLGGSKTAFLQGYADAIESIATTAPPPGLEGRIGCLNGMAVHGPWAGFNAFALSDGVHPTLAGVDYFAANEWKELMTARQQPGSLLRVLRSGGFSSQEATNTGGPGWFSETCDDFQLPATQMIGAITFWGTYGDEPLVPAEAFVLRVYADASGQPGELLHFAAVGALEVLNVQPGNGPATFRYSGELDSPFLAHAGVRYWLSVVAIQDQGAGSSSPQWGWLPSKAISPFKAHQRFGGEFEPLNVDMSFVLRVPSCYANCDGSSVQPVLNVADFACFLQEFASGSPSANCDGSSVAPVLNVADFGCFVQKFAAGCS